MSSKDDKPQIFINDNIDNKRYMQDLAKMMKVDNALDVNETLSVLFSKIGYSCNDKIYLSNVIRSAYDEVRLEFKVNDKETFKTTFHKRYGRHCLGLALTKDNKDHFKYRCDISRNASGEIDATVMLNGAEIGQERDLVKFDKDFGSYKYSFFSPASDTGFIEQVIGLTVCCSEQEKKFNRINKKYLSPKNEKALIAYLSNCTYPVDIGKIFEDVKELVFDGDVSQVPFLNLDVLTCINHSSGEERCFTDKIQIKNGKPECIGFSHIGGFGDCERNFGGAVNFTSSSGMTYFVLHLPGRWEDLGYIDDQNDSRVSQRFVNESARKVAKLFPIEAKEFLGERYVEDQLGTSEQMNFLDNVAKQYVKSSNN